MNERERLKNELDKHIRYDIILFPIMVLLLILGIILFYN